MEKEDNINIKNLSQEEIKDLAVLLLKKISQPERGLGTELFKAIIAVVPQVAVEAVIVDDINNPTKVLLTPRDDHDYPKACHLPGGFIRYGETFLQRLTSVIKTELNVGIKKVKDTMIVYNLFERNNKRHIIGLYFLVQLSANPNVAHRWVDYIPKNIVKHHKDFLKSYFRWEEGPMIWKS